MRLSFDFGLYRKSIPSKKLMDPRDEMFSSQAKALHTRNRNVMPLCAISAAKAIVLASKSRVSPSRIPLSDWLETWKPVTTMFSQRPRGLDADSSGIRQDQHHYKCKSSRGIPRLTRCVGMRAANQATCLVPHDQQRRAKVLGLKYFPRHASGLTILPKDAPNVETSDVLGCRAGGMIHDDQKHRCMPFTKPPHQRLYWTEEEILP